MTSQSMVAGSITSGCNLRIAVNNDGGKEKAVITALADEVTKNEADWRKLFSASPDQSMDYFPPQVENGQRAEGAVDLRPAGPNLFIIQFPNLSTRDRVLESGPWHIQNKPLIVRKWEPGMKTLEFNMTKLPVWIQLGNVLLELFTKKGLSYIASAVGVPLYMDQITASQQQLSFAKVCIELDALKEIPRTIDVRLRDGSLVSVVVEVTWKPLKCSTCVMFGHSNKDCPKKVTVTKTWMLKQPVAPLAKEDKVDHKSLKQTFEIEVKINSGTSSSSTGKAGSQNRFAVLDTINDNEGLNEDDSVTVMDSSCDYFGIEEVCIESRKTRAAAAGVAELMRNLKPKKKGPIDKALHQNMELVTKFLRDDKINVTKST